MSKPNHYVEPESFKLTISGAVLHEQMGEAEYRKYPAINQSFLKDCWSVSPFYAEYRRNNPETSPALEFGSALHCYVLEKHKFAHSYCVAPDVDRRTKEGKAAFNEFVLENGGKTPLKKQDFETIVGMDKAVDRLFVSPDAKVESVIIAELIFDSPDMGEQKIPVKAKLDWVQFKGDKAVIKDLKSIADITGVASASYHNNWAIQSALYTDMCNNLVFNGTDFYYIAVGKEPPHDSRAFKVSDEMLINGRQKLGLSVHRYLWWKNNGCPDTATFHGVQMLNG